MSELATCQTAPDLGAEAVPLQEERSFVIPENSRHEWGIALAIAILSCLYLLVFRRVTNLNPDEGLSLQGAQRILHGQIPCRDFFSVITPGSYYWTALLFKLFGNSILVARTVLVVYGGVFSLILYLLARRVCSRRNVVFGASLLAITCLPYDFIFQHNWDSTLWACLALYCAVRFLESAVWPWAFSAGFLASLTSLFEQSKGGGLVLGLTLGFVSVRYSCGCRALFTRRCLTAIGLGLALPLFVTVLYFARQHSLEPMVADWLWPLKHYNSVNRVPYGFMHLSPSALDHLRAANLPWKLFALFTMSPGFVLALLPILGLLVLATHLLKVGDRKIPRRECGYYILVCSCICGLLLATLDARPNLSHLMYLAPIFYVVLCWIFEGKAFGGRILPAGRRVITGYLVLSFAAFGFAMLARARTANHALVSRYGTQMTMDQDAVVKYVETHVARGSHLFVYPYQPLYYYLAGTQNPTSYDFLYQGFNGSGQFRQAMRQLDVDRTPVVLLCPSFLLEVGLNAFPGTPMRVIAQRDPMIDFIFSRYHPCKVLSSTQNLRYVFMVRKNLLCPPGEQGTPGHAEDVEKNAR